MKDISKALTITKTSTAESGGATTEKGYEFTFVSDSKEIALLLFRNPGNQPELRLVLDVSVKEGDVFSFALKGMNLEGYYYLFEDKGQYVADPYARRIQSFAHESGNDTYFGRLGNSDYDWEEDSMEQIPAHEMILYKLHVRGFTMNQYSKVAHKGSFLGLQEKIPYLLDLGINVLELMPVYAFHTGMNGVNYWGYGEGFYFAPNSRYSSHPELDETRELKDLIKNLHKNGMEVILEMNFSENTHQSLILDCLRFWKKEYHIDGVHLLVSDRVRQEIGDNPYLKGLKLFYTHWETGWNNQNLYEYNDNFMNVTRRLLKGDENLLQDFANCLKKNEPHVKTVNYITLNNGFTLNDLFTYDRKHNEANGEGNKDGVDFNNSWNCGAEGPTRKKKINDLRLMLMKNAMAILLTAQGIPLLYSGDEFRNSQEGNNNAYCQDNELGWVDWNAKKHHAEFYQYVKALIAFRKEHKILHMEHELYMMDYRYKGYPDMSFHGSRPWYPELEHYNRHIGIMLCGAYAEENTDIFLAYNLHWEDHEIALPYLHGGTWSVVFDTSREEHRESSDPGKINVNRRSVIILVNEKNS